MCRILEGISNVVTTILLIPIAIAEEIHEWRRARRKRQQRGGKP